MQIPPASLLDAHLKDMAFLARSLPGCLSEREVRFLALVAATLPPPLGEVLEIGSFKGKSTTVLAKSVTMAGGDRIIAVDPLNLPAATDPDIGSEESSEQAFWETLEQNDVRSLVEFHQMRSGQLASSWRRPIRFLWIDGDHSYRGVAKDVDGFVSHLRPGAIIAFHDVLHQVEGPLRVFCERVLLSSDFGPCGVCGSIGWAQYIGQSPRAHNYVASKMRLFRRLSRMLPLVALNQPRLPSAQLRYRLLRVLVPHGGVSADPWLRIVASNLPTHDLGQPLYQY